MTQTKTYAERKKLTKDFYLNLLKIFIVTALICGCGLGFLWYWLDKYEATTPNGAMTSYLKNVTEGNYDAIYEESIKVLPNFNEKSVYSDYIKNTYADKNLAEANFQKKSYSDTTYLYYDVQINNETVSTLQLRQTDNTGKWYVRTLTTARYFKFDTFEDGAEFIINGTIITDDFFLESGVPCEVYEGVPTGIAPNNVKRYYLDNLVDVPVVSVTDPENYLVVKDAMKDWFYIAKRPSVEQLANYNSIIEKVATTYCEFVTEDATFYQFNQLLYPNTTYQENISQFDNQYFSTHDSIEFQNIQIYDVLPLGETGFMGNISFDYVVTAGDIQQTYSSSYQLYFLQDENGEYLLTDLVIMSDDSSTSN